MNSGKNTYPSEGFHFQVNNNHLLLRDSKLLLRDSIFAVLRFLLSYALVIEKLLILKEQRSYK